MVHVVLLCSLTCTYISRVYREFNGNYVSSRTLNIVRTTIFIFYFSIRLVTQLNGSALGVVKHHYITKRIRELLIGNSRFFIYNWLNQLLFYTDIKESCLFVTEIVETLDLNN